MKLQDLVKKLHGLRDLRQAINEVKSLQKDAKVLGMPAKMPPKMPKMPPKDAPDYPKEQQRFQSKLALGGQKHLKHSGVKSTVSGIMTHNIAIPGSQHGYEIDVNMHDLAQKKPAFTVKHVDAGSGQVNSMHGQKHDTIGSAVKALVGHAHSGKWEE